jgi:hypothetical protein
LIRLLVDPMPSFRVLQAGLVLLLLSESACQKRQGSVPVPSPPAPAAPSQPTEPAPAPASTASAPAAASGTAPVPAQEPNNSYQVNKPPQAAAKKPSRPATPAAAPSPGEPAGSPALVPAPKLGDVLTPDEQRQYNASIDQSLSRAQASLNSIGGRQLSKDQQADVEQIRSFMQQAQASRGSDLPGAKSLAQRAEVLAKDMAATFH